ncbi:hypothetical protein [Gemmatimonas sp.]|uniref:hypothetical protein n=1 Tax=Gemmatimonas sp. TaxID=1962908 RepID=UPI0035676D30
MTRPTSALLLLATACALLAACAGDATPPTATAATVVADDHGTHSKIATGTLTVDQEAGIKAARKATARFNSFNQAQKAGYTTQFPLGCAQLPGIGAQAYHYMNPALVDNIIDLEHPELLMYEPQRNGSLELVGLDYVAPRPVNTLDNKPAPLLGMEFAPIVVQGVSVWALHIWAWRPNALGVFTPWNPAVSCQYQFQE